LIVELNARFKSTVLVAVMVAAAMKAANAEEKTEVSAEAYRVYSAVLTQQYRSWFKGSDPILIIAHTVLEPQGHAGYEGCRAQIPQEFLPLFDRLVTEKREFRIEPKLKLPGTYKMFHGKAIIRENKEPGVVFLSVVEFSNDHSRVVILAGHSCGGLCGSGSLQSLEKRSDGWHVAKNQPSCGWIR